MIGPLLLVKYNFKLYESKPGVNILQNFRWRRWGSSLPGLHTLDPPLSLTSTPVEFLRRMWWGGGISDDSKHFSFSQKDEKISFPGAKGFPQILLTQFFVCYLKPHEKCQSPAITPSGRKVTEA